MLNSNFQLSFLIFSVVFLNFFNFSKYFSVVFINCIFELYLWTLFLSCISPQYFYYSRYGKLGPDLCDNTSSFQDESKDCPTFSSSDWKSFQDELEQSFSPPTENVEIFTKLRD